ncbi:MAG: hypothetical protein U0168_28865 [Nannocystaceae bacterium]
MAVLLWLPACVAGEAPRHSVASVGSIGSGPDGDSSSSGAGDGSDEAGDVGGSSSSSSSAGDGTTGEDGCAQYCALIDERCTDAQKQYPGGLECAAVCAGLAAGTPDDQLGNTVACRQFHAISAAEDPVTHCLHAGPSGGGVCGGACENFCALALASCVGPLSPWDGVEACLADCAAFDTEPGFSATVVDGDSFACRMTHATLAAVQPDPHCTHIGAVSPVCTDSP